MNTLTRFIAESGGVVWREGQTDCCPWLLNWVNVITDQQVQPPPYTNRREAFHLIQDAGSLTLLIAQYCRTLGLTETLFPERGDIAVIGHSHALSRQTVGICLGSGRWAVRVNDGGIAKNTIIRAKPLKSWRVET